MKKFVNIVVTMLFTSLACLSVFAQNESAKIINGGILNGKAVSLKIPNFPKAAKEEGASGEVKVEVLIDEKGEVISAKAVSGNELLRKNSEEAALASKFSPTNLVGNPVKVTGIVVYNFTTGESSASNNKDEVSKNKDFIYSGILNNKALSLPKPEYPSEAKAAKTEGTVVVEVTINEDGKVISAMGFSDHELLRKEALKAAIKAKFSPFNLEGKPVKVKGILIYNFVAN
ncbi:MAG: energy transducer TonB [Pyrinomonadaceae bacterium]|nr:energy transducer TonB [Pyrinomonadaceae bacterium]